MTSFHQPTTDEAMDRVDAAHLLLGVSPRTVTDSVLTKETGILAKQDAAPAPKNQGSSGLDALAALATSSLEQVPIVIPAGNSSASSSSDEEDSQCMPPPPSRRMRSCSNPEGMEKWDHCRPRFVLPDSILEEELKSAKAAADAHRLQEPHVAEEMLRKSRARLLEDVTQESITAGQKSGIMLPHALEKYEHLYNKNGRIGIYSPAERTAIIARFHRKRSRRVWKKKIRYGCRKDLADRRLRVKGRFVKRVPENKPAVDEDMPDVNDPDAGFAPTEDQPYRRLRRHTIT